MVRGRKLEVVLKNLGFLYIRVSDINAFVSWSNGWQGRKPSFYPILSI